MQEVNPFGHAPRIVAGMILVNATPIVLVEEATSRYVGAPGLKPGGADDNEGFLEGLAGRRNLGGVLG